MLARVEKLGEAEGLISEPPKLTHWQHVLAGKLPCLLHQIAQISQAPWVVSLR